MKRDLPNHLVAPYTLSFYLLGLITGYYWVETGNDLAAFMFAGVMFMMAIHIIWVQEEEK